MFVKSLFAEEKFYTGPAEKFSTRKFIVEGRFLDRSFKNKRSLGVVVASFEIV